MKNKQSYFEEITSNILIKNKINFQQEYTTDALINDKGNNLYLDFFIEKKLAIEINGLHHYQSVNTYGGDSEYNFQRQLINDRIKREWCKNNNIELIEVDIRLGFKKIIKLINFISFEVKRRTRGISNLIITDVIWDYLEQLTDKEAGILIKKINQWRLGKNINDKFVEDLLVKNLINSL